MKVALMMALLTFTITIFLSGCTMPGTEASSTSTTTDGLAVDYVQSSMNYVMSGDSITIDAKSHNNGDKSINHVDARPFLLPWQGFNTVYPCEQLERPNAEIDRAGGVCYAKWPQVKVPKVDKQEQFDVGVRFYYDYSTETRAQVFAMSANQYAGYREREEPPPMTKVITNSNGPITVDVQIDSVIIIPNPGAVNRKVPVTLTFRNTGSGYPQSYLDSARNYQINSISVNAESTGGMFIDNIGSCGSSISMRGGKQGECIFWLSVPSTTTDLIEMDLRITSQYPYYVEGRSQITVNPNIEDIN